MAIDQPTGHDRPDAALGLRPISPLLPIIPAPGAARSAPPAAYAADTLQLSYLTVNGLPPALSASLQALPRAVVNKSGKPGDPINLVLLGSRAAITRLFQQAGWLPADRLAVKTGLKMVVRTLDHKPYPTAPVSSLYLDKDEHRQDLAFERPTATTTVRDHVRLWDTGKQDPQGQPIWIAAATKDIGIERNRENFGPTHRIDANVDAERDLVSQSLLQAGGRAPALWQRGAFSGVNGGGDPYRTDGRVAIVQAPGGA